MMRSVDGRACSPVSVERPANRLSPSAGFVCWPMNRSRGWTMTKTKSRHASRASLDRMLAQGWKVEPPVYARPRWKLSLNSNRKNTYHFVLWREKQVHLISVPEGPDIRQFLADHEIPVDHV